MYVLATAIDPKHRFVPLRASLNLMDQGAIEWGIPDDARVLVDATNTPKLDSSRPTVQLEIANSKLKVEVWGSHEGLRGRGVDGVAILISDGANPGLATTVTLGEHGYEVFRPAGAPWHPIAFGLLARPLDTFSGVSATALSKKQKAEILAKLKAAVVDPGPVVLYRSGGYPVSGGEETLVVSSSRAIGSDGAGRFRLLWGGEPSTPRIVAAYNNGNDALVASWRPRTMGGTSQSGADAVVAEVLARPTAPRPDLLAFAARDKGLVGFVASVWAEPDPLGAQVMNAITVAAQNPGATTLKVSKGLLGPLGKGLT